MLAAIVCSILSGARGFTAIAQWIASRRREEWHLLGFTRTPPTANAFRDLLLVLDPDALEAAVQRWTADCLAPQLASSENSTPSTPVTTLEAVALDGKTLRGTLRPHKRAIQLLSLFSHRTRLTLGQTLVPEETNEPTAATQWLQSLVLHGKVLTVDAVYCQRDFCQQTLDSGGHYLATVKDNQPTLKADIAAEFQAAFSPDDRSTTRRAA